MAAQRLALVATGWDADKAQKRNSAEVLNPLKKRGESQLSTARRVGQPACARDSLPENDTTAHLRKLWHDLDTLTTRKTNHQWPICLHRFVFGVDWGVFDTY